MSWGTAKNLRSWGRVTQALQKALQEQEIWKAAQNCLRATPRLGVGATMQTIADDRSVESTGSPCKGKEHLPLALQSPSLPHNSPAEQGQRLNDETVGGVGDCANKSDSGEVWDRPPPYAPQNGASQHEEGQSAEPPPATDSRGREKEGSWGEETARPCKTGEEGMPRDLRPSQGACPKMYPNRRRTSPSKGRGDRKGRERPTHRRGRNERGWSPTKRYRNLELFYESISASDSDSSWDDWSRSWVTVNSDSGSENEEVKTEFNTTKSRVPLCAPERGRQKEVPLTDWKKIQTACAGGVPPMVLAFPV